MRTARQRSVPEGLREKGYRNLPLPIGKDQTISPPDFAR